jgi:hypothetical protein
MKKTICLLADNLLSSRQGQGNNLLNNCTEYNIQISCFQAAMSVFTEKKRKTKRKILMKFKNEFE